MGKGSGWVFVWLGVVFGLQVAGRVVVAGDGQGGFVVSPDLCVEVSRAARRFRMPPRLLGACAVGQVGRGALVQASAGALEVGS